MRAPAARGLEEDRTACINRIRGLLAEFGLVFAQGPRKLRLELAELIEDASNEMRGSHGWRCSG